MTECLYKPDTFGGATITYAYDDIGNRIEAEGREYAGIAAHYEYAPFGAVTSATTTSTFTPRIITANPFRFSSEYYDDTLGLVYYNYRHYEPLMGRWLCRDPINEKDTANIYLFVQNQFKGYDSLGLWLGHTHESLTKLAFPYSFKGGLVLMKVRDCYLTKNKSEKMLQILINANVNTDSGDKGGEQSYHFCRKLTILPPFQTSDEAIDAYRMRLKEIENYFTKASEDGKCDEALMHLGTLTHMWQDYYAHGVNNDNWLGSGVGLISGKPTMPGPGILPASYGMGGFRGSHGGIFRLLNPFSNVEPGDRAPDRISRLDRASAFTKERLRELLDIWFDKCCCFELK